jgi:hypothetical protein
MIQEGERPFAPTAVKPFSEISLVNSCGFNCLMAGEMSSHTNHT